MRTIEIRPAHKAGLIAEIEQREVFIYGKAAKHDEATKARLMRWSKDRLIAQWRLMEAERNPRTGETYREAQNRIFAKLNKVAGAAFGFALLLLAALAPTAHAEELPNAPEPMVSATRPAPAPKNARKFTRFDYALVAGEFAARTADLITTEQCQHATKLEQFDSGVGAGTYWSPVHTCFEYELPQPMVSSWSHMAATSYGIAAAQTLIEWKLTHDGHRKLARSLALVSISATAGTAALNKIKQ